MASIEFPGVRIHPVSDPASQLVLNAGQAMKVDVSEADDDLGQVQTMCNGRSRAVMQEGRVRSVSVSVTHATRDTKESLEALRGRLVLYRDYCGNCLSGMIFTRRPVPKPGIDWYDLQFSVVAVTYDPAV
jgi:hypothetical protein